MSAELTRPPSPYRARALLAVGGAATSSKVQGALARHDWSGGSWTFDCEAHSWRTVAH